MDTAPGALGGQEEHSIRCLELARERLGAEVITTADHNFVEAVLRVAVSQNITQIVTGKMKPESWWQSLTREPTFARLARKSGDIAVHVVPLSPTEKTVAGSASPRAARELLALSGRDSGPSAVVISGGFHIYPLDRCACHFVAFAAGNCCIGRFAGRGPSLLATTLIAVAWDYFLFCRHISTLASRALEDAMLLGSGYFLVAVVLGQLTTRIRAEEVAERQREARATALYLLTRELAEATTTDEIFQN